MTFAPRPSPAARQRLNFAWLRRLRYAAAFGQGATVFVGNLLIPGELPVGILAVLVGIGAASQAVADLVVRRWSDARMAGQGAHLLTGLVTFDVVLLTALLAFSGGPSNPFTAFYIVHVVLSAVVLRPNVTWAISALAVLGYGSLFAWHVSVPSLEMSHSAHGVVHASTSVAHDAGPDAGQAAHDDHATHGGHEGHAPAGAPHDAPAATAAGAQDDGVAGPPLDVHRLHLLGMLVAFLVAAGFIVAFVTRLSSALQRREQELAAARERAGRERQLAAMADLAAGAAHELATPLATIAVVAGEVEQALTDVPQMPSGVPEDLRLIRSELARCRSILDQMSVGAGQPVGEAPRRVTMRDVVREALVNVGEAGRVDIEVADGADVATALPVHAVARALRSLITNALAAGDGRVTVRIERAGDRLQTRVIDRGVGMNADTLAHLGEPFFTTRAPGRGMGLGVYLAHHLAEAVGGALTFDSAVDQGTTATLIIPVSA